MTPLLRRLWLTAHRWIALTLGTLLAFAALLGALLTVGRPLDQALHPELFAQPAGVVAAAAPLASVRERLQQEFGAGTGYTFRPPRLPGDTLWVFVRGPWEGIVYFDAAGRELGRRGEHEGWFNLLFELHSALLLGDTGKGLLTAAAAAYVVLLVSGLVLWWPRQWPPSFRVARGAGGLRTWLDLHKVLGSLIGVLLLVSVVSGAYMAWPPLRELVSSAAGERPLAAPRVSAAAAGVAPASLDRLVETARAQFTDAMVGYVHVLAKPTQPLRVRLKTADDPHPNGLSSVWLHPVTGQVLKVVRWDALDAGNRIVTTMYPLHTGALGGTPHAVLTALAGLVLATLGFSGLALWWLRRSVRKAGAMRAARGGQTA
jgi:uncharacterized iron-regulated membrane protein